MPSRLGDAPSSAALVEETVQVILQFFDGALVLLTDLVQQVGDIIAARVLRVTIECFQALGFFVENGDDVVGEVVHREMPATLCASTAASGLPVPATRVALHVVTAHVGRRR